MSLDRNYMPLDSLYRHEKERPDDLWLTQPLGNGRLRHTTWQEAVDQARRMAAHLKSYGFPQGSTISIISKNCDEFMLADIAIWMAGHVASPIYPTLDRDTIAYILDHSDSKLVFLGKLDTMENISPALPGGIKKLAFSLAPQLDCPRWNDVVGSTEPIDTRPLREPDEVSLLFYTSGSTGRPKGVENTFANMAVAAKGELEVFPIGSKDTYLSYLPLAHSFETMVGLNLMLAAGAHVFFAETLDTFLEDLKRAQPSLFISVPRLWLKFQLGVFEKVPKAKLDRLLKIPIVNRLVRRKVLKGLGLDKVRFAISGSAPMPPDLIAWYRDLGLELLEGYGMTENFSYSHCSRPGRSRIGYVGHPFPGVECKIDDDSGEILVRSGATMKGYHKMPEETAAVIDEDGFLHTGDMGSIDEDGRLKITGRIKELFKTSKGKYVHPVPIENKLNASRFIELSLVAGLGREMPAAVVLLAEEYRKSLSETGAKEKLEGELAKLLDHVNSQLVDFERLKFIAVASNEWTVDDGLLTPTMKIRRAQLEERYGPRYDEWYSSGKKVVWE